MSTTSQFFPLSGGERTFELRTVTLYYCLGNVWSRHPSEAGAFMLGKVSIAKMSSTNPRIDNTWRVRALWRDGERPSLSTKARAEIKAACLSAVKA